VLSACLIPRFVNFAKVSSIMRQHDALIIGGINKLKFVAFSHITNIKRMNNSDAFTGQQPLYFNCYIFVKVQAVLR